jgi:hypothetical protein
MRKWEGAVWLFPLAVVGAVGIWMARDAAGEDASPLEAERPSVEEKAPASGGGQEALARADTHARRPAFGDPVGAARGQVPGAPSRRAPSFEESKRRALERVEQLEESFRNDATDAEWAAATERAARAVAASERVTVRELACASQLCRMRFEHDDGRKTVLGWGSEEPFRHGSLAFHDPDSDETLFFFAREGYPLGAIASERRP